MGKLICIVPTEPNPEPTHEPPIPSPSPTHEPSPIPSPSPTPIPSPSPTPSPEPTPTPIPTPPPSCSCGRDIEGQCIECPKTLSCTSLFDDPPGLMREGFGCDAKGGTGTGEIHVTVTGPDNSVGSLRWAYSQMGTLKRRIIIDDIAGDIILDTPLYWNKPYTTLDLSAYSGKIMAKNKATNGLIFTGTHDVIVYSGRGRGYFPKENCSKADTCNWTQPNNSGMFTLDGDGGPTEYSWDDQWDNTSPVLRRGVRNSIFDRNTLSRCEDDCLAAWEGVRDVSFTRNLIYDSFHPSTSGAKGTPLPAGRERLRNSYLYNVWANNGERQIKVREETYWWVYTNNIVFHWQEYFTKISNAPEQNWPYGFQFATQYPNENDYGWLMYNCFIPKDSGFHKDWGCVVENLGCEDPTCCAPACTNQSGKNIQCCNKKMKNTHWYMKNNTGAAIECNRVNPPGWEPFTLPFAITARTWNSILDSVGVVKRNTEEQALIDQIKAETGKCTVP